jgi:hypothetical protein
LFVVVVVVVVPPCLSHHRKTMCVPKVRAVASDPSEHVRASVASSVAALAPWAETTPSSQLLPVMLQLLRDTNSEVKKATFCGGDDRD